MSHNPTSSETPPWLSLAQNWIGAIVAVVMGISALAADAWFLYALAISLFALSVVRWLFKFPERQDRQELSSHGESVGVDIEGYRLSYIVCVTCLVVAGAVVSAGEWLRTKAPDLMTDSAHSTIAEIWQQRIRPSDRLRDPLEPPLVERFGTHRDRVFVARLHAEEAVIEAVGLDIFVRHTLAPFGLWLRGGAAAVAFLLIIPLVALPLIARVDASNRPGPRPTKGEKP